MTAGPPLFTRPVDVLHRAAVQILPEPFPVFSHRIDEGYSVHLHRVLLFFSHIAIPRYLLLNIKNYGKETHAQAGLKEENHFQAEPAINTNEQ